MKKNSLRIILLGAALSAVSITGLARAADPAPAPTPTPAPTTPPANGRFGNFNPADQLKNYRDQFEGIGLTDDQMKKIDGFLDTATTEVTKAADDRRAAFQALLKLGTDVQSILTDAQKAALRAKRNVVMFDRLQTTYTAAALNLTPEETTKITAIITEAKAKVAALPASADPQADRTQLFQLLTDTRTQLTAVLTPDQQKLIPAQRGFGAGGAGGAGGRRGGAGGAGGAPATPPAPPANQ